MKKTLFANGFILKIIALLTMTFDHVGLAMTMFGTSPLTDVFRIIGRLALPLFCFLIVEGVLNTKHFGKYSLRLAIMLVLVSTSLLIVGTTDLFGLSSLASAGNIFIDLLLGATAVYCLKNKNPWIKALALLPLLYSGAAFFFESFEINNNAIVWIIPYFLRGQYNLFSVLICIMFYIATVLKDALVEAYANNMHISKEMVLNDSQDRFLINVISAIFLAICTILYYFLKINFLGSTPLNNMQLYAMLSGIILLFYNGKRGYNAKWFQYGSYLYYPVHIGIIGLVIFLITL